MKAVYIQYGEVIVGNQPSPTLDQGEVLVKINAASLNRRDLYTAGRLGNNEEALIIGSDATGIIKAVAPDVIDWEIGQEVIVNPSLRWYENTAVPPNDFEILSLPDNGTFAEEMVISQQQLEKKPTYLTTDEAATIGIAPLTAYRALVTKGNIQAGQTIFIPGAGSGVATFIIQFAHALGARVIVSSRSEYKRQQALKIGADLAIDTNGDWPKLLRDEIIDLVIDSVGEATFNRSLEVLKKGGTLVTFGATTEDITSINLRDFFYGQYTLHGTTLGSREEFRACIELMTQHMIRPIIDEVYPLEEALQGIERLQVNAQFGKIVVTM
ncbi:MAG: zinc-binding dehydrogenase [Kurthia sp.]|nr:zinc-binding dehydrogenase [Candidatus Kurthia equi]